MPRGLNPNLLPSPRLRYIDEPPASGETPPAAAPAAPTFSQDDVTRLAAREKDQGRRQAAKDAGFVDAEGRGDPEALAAWIKSQRDAEVAKMSEADRKAAEAETAKQEAARERAAAAAERRTAARTVALATEGAVGENLTDALALVAARLGDEADPEKVKAEVTALKSRRPELFGSATPARRAPDGRPNGGPPPGTQTPSGQPGSRGREEAARRFAHLQRQGATS